MSEATRRLTAGTSAHGNAGEASIFLVLADRKLKQGGTLGLVMPLSLMLGEAWEESRQLLRRDYSELIVVSIAARTDDRASFSADTDMAECLVIAHKSNSQDKRGTFVVLNQRPDSPMLGASAAEQLRRLIAAKNLRRLEDGPVGGTPLYFGDDLIGSALDAPLPEYGLWNLGRIADLSLAQAAYQLASQSLLWLPRTNKDETISIPITTLGMIAKTGPIHRDINGKNPDGAIRGPFDIVPMKAGAVPTYPTLWSHHADRERSVCFGPDSEACPRKARNPKQQEDIEAKVEAVWASASNCHFNCDFRFNSQSTGMQFTPHRSIGGVAWLSVQMHSVDQEKTLALFGNTILGLFLRWWHSNKQQSGRGRIGRAMADTLPVLDIPNLSRAKQKQAAKVFDETCNKHLLPLHEIDKDYVRKELDERFGCEVLGLPQSIFAPSGPMELLRAKLSREPSIRGNK